MTLIQRILPYLTSGESLFSEKQKLRIPTEIRMTANEFYLENQPLERTNRYWPTTLSQATYNKFVKYQQEQVEENNLSEEKGNSNITPLYKKTA